MHVCTAAPGCVFGIYCSTLPKTDVCLLWCLRLFCSPLRSHFLLPTLSSCICVTCWSACRPRCCRRRCCRTFSGAGWCQSQPCACRPCQQPTPQTQLQASTTISTAPHAPALLPIVVVRSCARLARRGVGAAGRPCWCCERRWCQQPPARCWLRLRRQVCACPASPRPRLPLRLHLRSPPCARHHRPPPVT
jgi:hypothetical protein